MLSRLIQATDRFVGLKIDPLDRITFIRARLLALCVPLFGLFGSFLVVLYAQSPDPKQAIIISSAAASALMLTAPIILFFSKSTSFTGGITIFACLAALLPEILSDRGYYEAEVMITVLLPVLATVLVSRRGATITFAVITFVLIAALLKLTYWPPTSVAAIPVTEHIRYFFNCIAATTSGYVISMCLVWLFNVTLRDLQSAIAKAESASDAKTAFLANMSHEIRTPINGILGFSKLTLSHDLPRDVRNYISTINSSGETLLSIVNDVLDVSKLEAGAFSFDEVDFNLGAVLDDVLVLHSQNAAQKGLHLGAVASAGMPSDVRGDPGRLRQILTNLIANAIKFTDTGGIILNVDGQPTKEGHVELRFEVVDTGIGIPDDKIPALFDRFTQVDASTSRRYGGTGLGLAICKDLIDLMNGKIGVQSVQERGSIFWFSAEFPVVKSNRLEESSVRTLLGNSEVLVIGDPDINQTIIGRQLDILGIRHQSSGYDSTLAQKIFSGNRKIVILSAIPTAVRPVLQKLKAEHGPGAPKFVELNSIEAGAHLSDREPWVDASAPAPLRHNQIEMAIVDAFNDHPQVSEPETVLPTDGNATGHILLAEDNASNQLLFQTLLKKAGYKVDTVVNGFEAVKAVRQQSYDLILMDGQMPEMSGVEAARRIRSEGGPQSSIPIIALTANTMKGDKEAYLRAGMNDYLAKPIEFDQFFDKVAKWTRETRTATKTA